MRYNQAAQHIWRPMEQPLETSKTTDKVPVSALRELVRYATLAPSSHNTQCWKFQIEGTNDNGAAAEITVRPDLERRCSVVDPDDHHLYVSLGCAFENLVIAAEALGLEAKVDSTNPQNGIRIQLVTMKPPSCPSQQVMALFEAIPHRRVTRAEYNGEPLSDSELEQLRQAVDTFKGVRVVFLTDEESLETALDHITRANTIQVQDKDFRQELLSWMRFGEQESVASGDGMMGPAMGSPFIPRWIGQLIFPMMLRASPENEKITRQLHSLAGLAVFVSEHDDREHWVEVGRAYECFSLQATAMGIKNSFLNQAVEVSAATRSDFAKAFQLNGRPDLVVRFGKGGPDLPHSLRRPLEDVLKVP